MEEEEEIEEMDDNVPDSALVPLLQIFGDAGHPKLQLTGGKTGDGLRFRKGIRMSSAEFHSAKSALEQTKHPFERARGRQREKKQNQQRNSKLSRWLTQTRPNLSRGTTR